MKKNRIVIFSFFLSFLVSMIFVVTTLDAKSNSDQTARIEAWKKLSDVVNKIEDTYVDELEAEEIYKKALNGLLRNLDAHSSYLDKKQYKEMTIKTSGEFGGLGIHVGMRDGALTIIAPIEGTPADKVGVESGDIILKIDEKSTLDMTLDEAVSLMRGKPKTKIELTLVRKGEQKPLIKTIVRDVIKIDSVYTKLYKDDILYVRIVSFDKNVESEIKKSIQKHQKTIKGIVLDLRNNPGGLLDQAVKTVDLFVDKGIIVSQKGRNESENIDFKASSSGTFSEYPIIVLVNGGSASASEIVSGSLQDHKRAVVIGEKTFGKGSVQAILPISQYEAIRLTVARYYLPSGRTIQAVGVDPDIEVKQAKIEELDDDFEIKESQLKKHLAAELEKVNGNGQSNDNSSSDKKEKKELEDKEVLTAEAVKKDYQLRNALGILRALIIVK